MNIIAIDPGSEYSAFVIYNGVAPHGFGKVTNQRMREVLIHHKSPYRVVECRAETLVVEMLKPRGMPTSMEEMRTLWWIGRFAEIWGDRPYEEVGRMDVKLHMCGSVRASDPNIRRAVIDKWGGDNKAIGGKKCRRCKGKGWFGRDRPTCTECNGGKWRHPPGPLFGVTADVWQAMGVAITWWEKR